MRFRYCTCASYDILVAYFVSGESLRLGHTRFMGAKVLPQAPHRAVVIRIMDPAIIAHGMNYFWRRAHVAAGVEVPLNFQGGLFSSGGSRPEQICIFNIEWAK